jgi:hypothetical protein
LLLLGCEKHKILYLTIDYILSESELAMDNFPNCNRHNMGRSDKMNNQSKVCKKKLNRGTVQIAKSLSNVSIEVRKKAASEPIYVNHL